MELMSIARGAFKVQVFYDYVELCSFTFTEDIKLGDWTVGKIVAHKGPKYSDYKYDWKKYLEFLITDKRGESHVKLFYYNMPCKEMPETRPCPDSFAHMAVRHLLENHPIFDSEDWADYDNLAKLAKIKSVLNSDELSASVKIEEIKNILQKSVY